MTKQPADRERIAVRGAIDLQTRCAHYHSSLDVIAIRMKCCDAYYACKDCHVELADHPIAVWLRHEWNEAAILCGVCRTELTINEYLGCNSRCPSCSVLFNPNCRTHHHFYFQT